MGWLEEGFTVGDWLVAHAFSICSGSHTLWFSYGNQHDGTEAEKREAGSCFTSSM